MIIIFATKLTCYCCVSTAPSAPPQNVQAFVTTDLVSPSATISWDPPPVDQQNGVITRYIVLIRNIDMGVSISSTVNHAPFNVFNLVPNTAYSVRVRARTLVGVGPLSQPSTFNTRTGGEATSV